MTISQAAERLGVSTRQVQYLVTRGKLQQPVRGIVEEISVERLFTVRGESHTRAWSDATAWGAVALLSGRSAEWMGKTQRSRLRARLHGLTAADLVDRARERAEVTHYRTHPSTGQRLLTVLVNTTSASDRLGLAATNSVDGYLSISDLPEVVRNYGLIRDDEGRVTLRATSMNLESIRDLANSSVVLAALDLAGSLDVRERRAGTEALKRAMANFGD